MDKYICTKCRQFTDDVLYLSIGKCESCFDKEMSIEREHNRIWEDNAAANDKNIGRW